MKNRSEETKSWLIAKVNAYHADNERSTIEYKNTRRKFSTIATFFRWVRRL